MTSIYKYYLVCGFSQSVSSLSLLKVEHGTNEDDTCIEKCLTVVNMILSYGDSYVSILVKEIKGSLSWRNYSICNSSYAILPLRMTFSGLQVYVAIIHPNQDCQTREL